MQCHCPDWVIKKLGLSPWALALLVSQSPRCGGSKLPGCEEGSGGPRGTELTPYFTAYTGFPYITRTQTFRGEKFFFLIFYT